MFLLSRPFVGPYNISSLEADTLNTTSIHLNWTKPLEYKRGYSYRIKSANCASHNKTVEEEEAVMTELLPGTNCTFYVFVQAEDGIEGEPYHTSQYTCESPSSHFDRERQYFTEAQ